MSKLKQEWGERNQEWGSENRNGGAKSEVVSPTNNVNNLALTGVGIADYS